MLSFEKIIGQSFLALVVEKHSSSAGYWLLEAWTLRRSSLVRRQPRVAHRLLLMRKKTTGRAA